MLHEALTVGPDPLHLALVFNLSHSTASRYAAIAQNLLDESVISSAPSTEPTPGTARQSQKAVSSP